MRKYKTIRGLFANIDRWVRCSLGASHKDDTNFATVSATLTSRELTCVCLEGAIRFVYPARERPAVRAKLLAAIEKYEGEPVSIINWNDSSFREFDEVVTVVRRAGV